MKLTDSSLHRPLPSMAKTDERHCLLRKKSWHLRSLRARASRSWTPSWSCVPGCGTPLRRPGPRVINIHGPRRATPEKQTFDDDFQLTLVAVGMPCNDGS